MLDSFVRPQTKNKKSCFYLSPSTIHYVQTLRSLCTPVFVPPPRPPRPCAKESTYLYRPPSPVIFCRRLFPLSPQFVTASSGVAACNINGTTVHSFAGVGLGEGSLAALVKKAGKGQAGRRWKKCKVLIIDEVSMIDGAFFTTLEKVARAVRGSTRPFGGIQVVLFGDFFQLPPVTRKGSKANFCFQSEVWPNVIEETINLKEVFRQKDQSFVDMLNRFRVGAVLDADQARLQQCVVDLRKPEPYGIEPTRLYPTRSNAERHNQQSMKKINVPWEVFPASDSGDQYALQTLDKNCTAPASLSLKSGAQVILLKNIDVKEGLVNGARGVIDSFRKAKTADLKQRGQGRTREDLQYGVEHWPVVRFANGSTRLIMSEKWSTTSGGKEIAKRLQVPLAPAWALSIHKAQGMTLDRVTVSLENIFEDGQAYVALSRVTGLGGLRLSSFKKSCIKASPAVVQFYQGIDDEAAERTKAGAGGGGGGAAAAAAGAPPPVSRFAFKPGRNADSGGEAAGCGGGGAAAAIITEETVALAERQARIQANRAKALERRRNAKRTPDGPPQEIPKAGGGGSSSSTYASVRPAKMAKLDTSSHTNDCGSNAADAEPETGTAAANITHAALRIEAVAAAAAAWAAIPTPDEGAPAVVSDAPTVKLAVAVTTTAAANTQSPLAARIQANREKALRLRRVSKSSPESSGGSIGSSSSRGGEVVAGGGAGNALPAAAAVQSMDVDGAGAGASVGAATEAALEAALPMAVDPEPSPILSARSAPSPTGEPPMMGSLSSSPPGAAEAHAQAGLLQPVASRLPLAHDQRLHLQDQKPVHMEVCTAASRAPAAPAAPAQPASSRAEANRIAAMQRRQAPVTAPTAATPPISRAEANKVAAMKRRNARLANP